MSVRKVALACLALLFGGTLIGAYHTRERTQAPAARRLAMLRQMDRAGSLYLVSQGDRRVGYSMLQIEPLGDSLYVREDAEVRLPAPGGASQVAFERTEQMLDASLAVARFSFLVRSQAAAGPPQQVQISGVRRSLTDDSVQVTIATGGRLQQVVAAFPRTAVLGAGLWARLLVTGSLEADATHQWSSFDPLSLQLRPTTLAIGTPREVPMDSLRLADEADATQSETEVMVRLFPVEQQVGGLTYRLELAETGLPVRADLPLGLRLTPATARQVLEVTAAIRRTDAGVGYGAARGADAATVVGLSAIQAGAVAAGMTNARTADTVVLRVRGVALPPAAHGAGQHVADSVVTVARTPWPNVRSITGAGESQLPESARVAALQPEPFIESTHPELTAASRAAVGAATAPRQIAERITHFVYRRLTKTYTASLPSAIEAWRGGGGDCNEHTVLTVALLRAAGVPARPVSGVALVDGAFYFHAWVEAWVDDRWVALDPTFGLAPADAARLRLAVGMPHLNTVVGYLSQLELEVLRHAPVAP